MQHKRVPKCAKTAAQKIKFGFPIELVPIGEQQLAILQLGFPFLPPVGSQAPRNHHANQPYEPEPKPKPCCVSGVSHHFVRSAADELKMWNPKPKTRNQKLETILAAAHRADLLATLCERAANRPPTLPMSAVTQLSRRSTGQFP